MKFLREVDVNIAPSWLGGLEYAGQKNGFLGYLPSIGEAMDRLAKVIMGIERGDPKLGPICEAGFAVAARDCKKRTSHTLSDFPGRMIPGQGR